MRETGERSLIREAAQAATVSAADLLAERKHSESAPDALMAIRHEVAEWVERAKLAIPANNDELREIVWQSLMAAYGTGVSHGIRGVGPSEQVKAVDEMTDRLLARLALPATAPRPRGAPIETYTGR